MTNKGHAIIAGAIGRNPVSTDYAIKTAAWLTSDLNG